MLSMEVEEVLGCPTETIHWTDPRAFHYYPYKPNNNNNNTNNSNSNSDDMNVNCEENYEKSSLSRVMDVIFIPGNPGAVVFYLDFLQQLQGLCKDALPGCEVNMHALSHANHHLKPAGVCTLTTAPMPPSGKWPCGVLCTCTALMSSEAITS